MKFRIKLFFILLIFVSCKSQDTIIKGFWTSEESPSVDFIILDNNKIWFFESADTNTYKINDNIIYLYEKDYLISSYKILKLTNDSLILQTEEGNTLIEYKIKD